MRDLGVRYLPMLSNVSRALSWPPNITQLLTRLPRMYKTMPKSPGGIKRPAAAKATETSRKRAPYTARACGVCRRRKRRCSGDNPCTYCASRSLICDDLSEPPVVVSQAASPPPSLSSRDPQDSSMRTFSVNKQLAQTSQTEMRPYYESDLE